MIKKYIKKVILEMIVNGELKFELVKGLIHKRNSKESETELCGTIKLHIKDSNGALLDSSSIWLENLFVDKIKDTSVTSVNIQSLSSSQEILEEDLIKELTDKIKKGLK